MNVIDAKTASFLKGKYVFLRVDWNVPCYEKGMAPLIAESTRIVNTKETLDLLCFHGARVIVLSHFGRPTQAKKALKEAVAVGHALSSDFFVYEDAYSFKPLVPEIGGILDIPITYVENPLTSEGRHALSQMSDGDVVLCDNVRFFAGEEVNDDAFAKELAACADAFINEAFSCCHRAHSSVEAITHHLPSYAGMALFREVSYLEKAFVSPKRPVWAIVGGAKVSSKIDLLMHVSQKVDGLIIGGAMANTFLKAKGFNVGQSLVEDDHIKTAEAILAKASAEIVLPCDGVAATDFDDTAPICVDYAAVPETHCVFDIGAKSRALFAEKLSGACTIIWNGPVGVFEHNLYAGGSMALARLLTQLTQTGVLTLAGGGDTLAALAKADVLDKLSYCSTAGGAFLESLEGKVLPGVKALV